MKLICNNCKRKSKAIQKKRKLPGDITEIYLKCPKCKEEIRVALINKEIEALQNKIAIYRQEGRFLEIVNIQVELKEKLDKLNGKS